MASDKEIMDSMCGEWVIDSKATENFDAYADAMELPADLREKIKNETNMICTMKRDGDEYSVATTLTDGSSEVLKFKLGESFTSKQMDVEVKNVFTVENGASIGKHEFMGMETLSKRYLKDGKLIIESTGKGVTMKNVMNKK